MRSKRYFPIVMFIFILILLTIVCSNPSGPSSSPGYYVASSTSDVFHKPDCRYVDQINAENKITFNSRQDAIDAGYHACSVCKP